MRIKNQIMHGLLLGAMGCVAASFAQAQVSLKLMPMPAKVVAGSGQLAIDPSFTVAIDGAADARVARGVDRFLSDLRRETGVTVPAMKVVEGSSATLVVLTTRTPGAGKATPELGEDESYTLEITSAGAKLTAGNTLGVLRGLQTFEQLVEKNGDAYAAPEISIHDRPRFPWRGLMIDTSRHFIPLDVLKRNLDGMAAVKLNVFHWHLSDDQGFRAESRKFPKLQGEGSDGFYYTQEEMRALVGYAAERGIRVVPEFDMPGHTTSWFVGYPELASGPGPYAIERGWGVFNPTMDPTREETYKFLDGFIGEMARIFPDRYFHIGGDEVTGNEWRANPRIRRFMRAHGLRNAERLQAYFNRRVQAILSKHGKTMIGWDEILNRDLPKSIVIQSWRGHESLTAATRQGYRGVLSTGYYLDLNLPASQRYRVDPDTGAVANPRILGGEACMWSEYVSPENIDSRIWPQAAAIAERLWSPASVNDVEAMYLRLEEVSRRLEGLGLAHNASLDPMLRRIAGEGDIAALRDLADVVEPVKNYARQKLAAAPATSATALDRMVDASRPESATARRFSLLVDRCVAHQASAEEIAVLRDWLTRWRDNYAHLQPLGGGAALAEVAPLSRDLSALGAAGLEALDYLQRGEVSPEVWRAAQLARMEAAAAPRAQLLLMIAPAVSKLVGATGGR